MGFKWWTTEHCSTLSIMVQMKATIIFGFVSCERIYVFGNGLTQCRLNSFCCYVLLSVEKEKNKKTENRANSAHLVFCFQKKDLL